MMKNILLNKQVSLKYLPNKNLVLQDKYFVSYFFRLRCLLSFVDFQGPLAINLKRIRQD